MKNIKNKISKKKFEITFILMALLCMGLLKIVTMTVTPVSADDASSVPSLFYNDNAFMFDYLWSLEKIDGIYYVPIELFKLINDVTMKSEDRYTENFYIQYKKYDWIAFKVSGERAESRTKYYIPCKVYLINGTAYVPAEITAENLGLECEIRAEYNTLRIKGDTARKTFDQLIDGYIIKPKPVITTPEETAPPTQPIPTNPPSPVVTTEPAIENTTSPTIDIPPITDKGTTTDSTTFRNIPNTSEYRTTEPPTTTEEPTTAENTREIQNYLMFYDSSPSYDYTETTENIETTEEETKETEEIETTETVEIIEISKTDKIKEVLKILDKNKMKAVFFLNVSEIKENPDILRRIYSSGHELGIKINPDNTEDLIKELESANDFIYSALKHKTRFCMFEKSENLEMFEEKLTQNGYYLCKKNVDIPDLEDIKTTTEMTDFLKQKTYNVFMFDLNSDYKNYIIMSARASENKFYIKFSYINNANIENIKRQINRQDTK